MYIKREFLKITLLLLTTGFLSGCIKNIQYYRKLDVVINSDLNLSPEAVKKLIKVKLNKQKGSGTIEILIYSYSSGAEIIEYNEKEGFKQYFSRGKMSAMIKFKRSGRVREVKFTSASGRSSAEIIKKLTYNINRIVNGR
jgi:phosphoribosyl-AMP cyclohydrolase